MGFITSAATFTIKGKLTPIGRQLLITNTNALISTFALGDSDADYTVYSGLTYGQVPDFSGDLNAANNGGANYNLRSVLFYNGTSTIKPVETSSLSINTSYNYKGLTTTYYSGGTISQNIINRLSGATDSLTNLFHVFGLPTRSLGGYADTPLSGMSQDKALVIALSGSTYGEMIDGKSIKLTLNTTGNTYDIYGTFANQNISLNSYDNLISDTSNYLPTFGNNTVLLFSDDIMKPNGGDSTKSWSTGYSSIKPFSLTPRKELWNLDTNEALSLTADTPVGIAYLDKGFLVITEPTIVNEFNLSYSSSTATTIEFNSVNSYVSQQVTCIADRNTFVNSSNTSFSIGDVPRITEIGLFDVNGNLIAMAKPNTTYYKNPHDIVVFNVIIDY